MRISIISEEKLCLQSETPAINLRESFCLENNLMKQLLSK